MIGMMTRPIPQLPDTFLVVEAYDSFTEALGAAVRNQEHPTVAAATLLEA